MSNNRRHGRVSSGLRCWCEGDNVTLYTRVGNLSEGGLFVRTSTPLAPGSRALVRLRDGDMPEVRTVARVVWTREADDEGPPGMGLEFDGLDEGEREVLGRLLTRERRPGGGG